MSYDDFIDSDNTELDTKYNILEGIVESDDKKYSIKAGRTARQRIEELNEEMALRRELDDDFFNI